MRIKMLILLVCLGLLVPVKVWADVDALYFRFNENGEIIDMGSTGADGEGEQNEKSDSEEEPKTPVTRGLTKGEPSVDCSSVGGTSKTYGGETYCCDSEGKVYENGAWSSCPKIPECGCSGETYQSFLQDGGAFACCNFAGQSVISGEVGGCSTTAVPSDLCGCPSPVEGVIVEKVATLSNASNGLYCCGANDKRLRYADTFFNGEDADCACYNDVAECADALQCTRVGHTWCTFGSGEGWCTTEASCETECGEYAGYWCESDNSCKNEFCDANQVWNDETCSCDNICSDAYPDACTTQETCQQSGSHWCNNQCQKASCCEAGKQQLDDGGECYVCPSDGSLHVVDNEIVCCKNDEIGQIWDYGSDYAEWTWSAKCGCPSAGSEAVEPTNGECCHNGFAFNPVTGTYDNADFFDVCQTCPEVSGKQGIFNEQTKTCCYNGYAFDANTNDYGTTRDVEKCGCLDGETLELMLNATSETETFCCRNGSIVAHYPDNPTTQPVKDVCYCSSGYRVPDTDPTICAVCLTDEHCGGGTARCAIDAKNPANNVCAGCTEDEHCLENQVCKNGTCEMLECPIERSHYLNHQCYECYNDMHCAGNESNQICDLNTHTCVACMPSDSSSTIASGCDGVRPYCVTVGKEYLCSQCRTDADCPNSGEKCQQTRGECAKEECTKDRDCRNPSKPKCNLNTHSCVAESECADGKCECGGNTPVWDIYEKKCVHCYDSIGEDWTDLGCPDGDEDILPGAINPSSYDPHQYVGESSKRICLAGRCVQCLKNGHCKYGNKCINNTCQCDSTEPHYHETLKMCVQCTVHYGTTADNSKKIWPCPSSKPFCNNSGDNADYKCYECNANYGVTGSGKVACSSTAKPICNTTTHMCDACPSATPSYSTSSKTCVACDSNSEYNNSSKKCVCKEPAKQGVVNKRCVDAGISGVSSSVSTNSSKQACQTQEIFRFTTVNGLKYKLTFSGGLTVGDWAKFKCDGAILPKVGSTTAFISEKKWCSNNKEQRDTNPDDNDTCSDASSGACKEGQGNGKSCARATKLTASDDVTFVGDGGKCVFSVTNGNGGCTKACSTTNINVVPVITSYAP